MANKPIGVRAGAWILAGVVATAVTGSAGVRVASSAGSGGENLSAPASVEWPTVSGDWGNTRYSTLSSVDARSVSKLAGTWMRKFDDSGAGRATPVVRDGLMFVSAGSWVYAFNAKTGEVAWRYQSGGAQPNGIGSVDSKKNGAAFPGREGVAVGDGLVFTGLADGTVIALREKTGEIAWTQYVGDNPPRKGQSANGAPIYAGGTVYVGTAADFGFRGQVVALDARTGHEVWRWFAVPAPGQSGFETWPKNTGAWQTGGGALWLVGAADSALGLVYFGTGNAVPQYGGDNRAGDNLYTCSVVALDMKTGKLRWHYQLIRHDIWEADIAISPLLYEVEIGGRTRKAIATMRADGYLFLLDRETGKPLIPVEERKVSAGHAGEHGGDAALPRQRQPRAAGLRRVEEAADSIRIRPGLLLRAGLARRPEPPCAVMGHAHDPDGLQPARPDTSTRSATPRSPGSGAPRIPVFWTRWQPRSGPARRLQCARRARHAGPTRLPGRRSTAPAGPVARWRPPGACCFR